MATRVTREVKENLNLKPEIPNKNKVRAEDLNEDQNAINDHATEIENVIQSVENLDVGETAKYFPTRAEATAYWNTQNGLGTPPAETFKIEIGDLKEYHTFYAADAVNRTIKVGSALDGLNTVGYSNNTAETINLYNKEIQDYYKKEFIKPTTGLSEATTYDLFISKPILIDSNQTELTISINSSLLLNNTVGWRFKDIEGNILSFGTYSVSSNTTIPIPSNAFTFEASLSTSNYDVMIEYGNTVNDYVFFKSLSRLYRETSLLGNNIFNIENIGTENKYINPSNGLETATGNSTVFLSDKILLDLKLLERNDFNITLSTTTSFNSVFGWVCFDETGDRMLSFGSLTDNPSVVINVARESAYLQFTTWSIPENVMVNYGSVAMTHETYNNTNLKKDLDYTLKTENGNLFDVHSCTKDRELIDATSGEILSVGYNTFVGKKIYLNQEEVELTISVDEGFTLFTNHTYRFLRLDGGIVSSGEYNGDRVMTIAIPENASFFEFTGVSYYTGYKVEYGSQETNSKTSVSNVKGNDSRLIDWDNSIVLPKTLHLTNNRTNFLYFDNIIRKSNKEHSDVYMDWSGVSTNYNRFCKITPNTVESSIKNLMRLRANTEEYLYMKGQSIEVVNKAVGSVSMLKIGDSFSEIGQDGQRIYDNLISDGLSVEMVGAMTSKNSANGKSENQTGGTLSKSFLNPVSNESTYMIDATGVQLDKIDQNFGEYSHVLDDNGIDWIIWGSDVVGGSGKVRLTTGGENIPLPVNGSLISSFSDNTFDFNYTNAVEVNKNPFWNINTNQLDFSNYFNSWGFTVPDIVLIQFMWNDTLDFGENVDSLVANTRVFIDAFKSEYPTTKFIFSIEPERSSVENDNDKRPDGRKKTVFDLLTKLEVEFDSEYNQSFFIAPSYAFVDRINGFDKSEVVVNPLYPNDTISISSDTVHPNEGGMFEIGDCVTNSIHKALSI